VVSSTGFIFLAEARPLRLVRHSREEVARLVRGLADSRFTEVLELGEDAGAAARRSSGIISVSSDDGSPVSKKAKQAESPKRVVLKKSRTLYSGLAGIRDYETISLGFRDNQVLTKLKDTLNMNGGYSLQGVSCR
jgi:hypothetical protein